MILATILCSLPFLIGALDGTVTATSAVIRLVIVLLVCWMLVAVAEKVLGSYARDARRRRAQEQLKLLRGERDEEPPPDA